MLKSLKFVTGCAVVVIIVCLYLVKFAGVLYVDKILM